MKKLLKRAGLEGKQTVFLFTDTQIIHDTFLEVSHLELKVQAQARLTIFRVKILG